MLITMGAEIALSLHLDSGLTYTDIEAVLVDAGFTNYTIMRTLNVDDTCDVQLFVRNELDANGYQPLDASDTLQKLSTAIDALVAIEPEEPPSE